MLFHEANKNYSYYGPLIFYIATTDRVGAIVTKEY